MSKPVFGIFLAALTLLVVLPGCSVETPALGPTTEATGSITEMETTSCWATVIGLPKGWLLAYPCTLYDTIMVRESCKQGDREGISTGPLLNDGLRKYDGPLKLSPETGKLDVDAYCDAWLTDTSMYDRYTSNARFMESRTVGGEYAAGSTYTIITREGEIHACQFWMVGHPGGLWGLYVCSAPREADIVPELLTALEATRWIDTPPTFSCSKAEDSNYPC